MPLTLEQFKKLRSSGLSTEQIAKFESGFSPTKSTPQQKPGIMNKISSAFEKGAKMFLAPTVNAIQTGIMQPIRGIQSLIPGGKTGREVYQTPFGENKNVKDLSIGQKIMQPLDIAAAGLPVENIIKTPLTKLAAKLYQSGLKPGNIVKAGKVVTNAEEIAKIGVDEGVWLTKGGVERIANRIDNFENMLGDVIEAAKEKGIKVQTTGLKTYLSEAKTFFADQFDVESSKKAIQEIDNIGKEFLKKYGDELPIEQAQKIKVATGQALKKYYDRMSSAGIEGTKQGVRYLKDKIVEVAPKAGEINKRLSNLYKFDQALTKASGRIGNLNLLGLPSKIGGAVAGGPGLIAGKLLELLDAPSIKSGAAIGLDRFAKVSGAVGKGVKIPISSLITYIVDELSNSPEEEK